MGMHHGNSFNREVNERFKSEQYDESELDGSSEAWFAYLIMSLVIITPFAILGALYFAYI
jgi:hypothetical protein